MFFCAPRWWANQIAWLSTLATTSKGAVARGPTQNPLLTVDEQTLAEQEAELLAIVAMEQDEVEGLAAGVEEVDSTSSDDEDMEDEGECSASGGPRLKH